LYRTQLRERRQRAVETLPELGQDVRRLANLAYPTALNDVRETLAKEQFIDSAIDGDMRLRTRAVSQQLFAFFLLAEFYTTQSGSRAKTAPLKT
jgi:hypothetical protein